MTVQDQPIALRRQRRRSTIAPHLDEAPQSPQRHSTRTRRLTSKALDAAETLAAAASTPKPAVKTPAKKNVWTARRRSEPARKKQPVARAARASGSGAARRSSVATAAKPIETLSGTVMFQPLRAVLEGRVLRRLRRNGLSEEMNSIDAENKNHKRMLREQLRVLKRQLEERDREIDELRNSTIMTVQDDTRVWDLERQIQSLRDELNHSTITTPNTTAKFNDWSSVDGADFNDDESDLDSHYDDAPEVHDSMMVDDDHTIIHHDNEDDEEFGNSTIGGLSCGTPERSPYKESTVRMNGSFMTPPITSPDVLLAAAAAVMTSTSSQTNEGVQRANAAVQAVMEEEVVDLHIDCRAELNNYRTDMEKELTACRSDMERELTVCRSTMQKELTDYRTGMEKELATMHAQMDKANETIAMYSDFLSSLKTQVGDYTENETLGQSTENVKTHVKNLLEAVTAKTNVLDKLTSSLHSLGFQGTDAQAIVDALSVTFRDAQTELEYLFPGEQDNATEQNSQRVFDTVLIRLREMFRHIQEEEEIIQELQRTEVQLRDARDALSRDIKARDNDVAERDRQLEQAEALLRERDATIEALEGDVHRLEGHVGELEGNVNRLEGHVTELEGTVSTLKENVVNLENNVSVLENDLAGRASDIELLKERVASLQAEKEAAEASVLAHQKLLAERDERILELEDTVADMVAQTEALTDELQDAHEKHNAAIADMLMQHSMELDTAEFPYVTAIMQRDAKVAELGADISRLRAELAAAQATVRDLRDENGDLRRDSGALVDENGALREDVGTLAARLEEQRMQAAAMVEAVREDLHRALKRSAQFLATPMAAPAAKRRRVDDDVVMVGSSMARRAGEYLPKTHVVMAEDTGEEGSTQDSGIALEQEDDDATLVMQDLA